jgi:UDP-glucuronate 4-epimerase
MGDKRVIVITGCSGFLGRHLCKYLSKEYYIIGYDKVQPHKDFARYIDRFVHRDITEELLKHHNIYAVIHLAAKAGVRESYDNTEEYLKNNIYGTKCVLDACVKWWKPQKILLASSSSVYGDIIFPSKEGDITNPKSIYAMTKLTMETLAKVYLDSKLLDCNICNLRIFTVYGEHQRKGLAIRNFIDNTLEDKPIIVYGDGSQSRDFTYIDDFCLIVEGLLRKGYLPFVLNTGFGDTTTVKEVIDIISKHLDRHINIKYEPMNRYDVQKTQSDTMLLDLTLPNIQQTVDVEEGIKRQIEWSKLLL